MLRTLTRTLELKDGNPLNEAQMPCTLIQDRSVMAADKMIRYYPSESDLKIKPAGDQVE
jgi:hypothetical protein